MTFKRRTQSKMYDTQATNLIKAADYQVEYLSSDKSVEIRPNKKIRIPTLRSGKPDLAAIRARKLPEDATEYQKHLVSDAWSIIRRLCFERDGYRCVVCFTASELNCHHRTYARVGQERLGDVTTLCRTLCRNCHEIFSKNGVLVREMVG